MTRAELVQRMRDSGLEFLTAGQANAFVNEAAAEFGAEELWPWRTAVASGSAPLYVANLGPVDYVTVPARRVTLYPQRKSRMLDQFGSLDSPQSYANWYYVELTDSLGGTINLVPAKVETIAVQHFQRRWWTVGGRSAFSDTDTPVGPPEHNPLIELLARERALRMNHEIEEAMAVRQDYQTRLEEVKDKETKMLGGWDEPDLTVESADW